MIKIINNPYDNVDFTTYNRYRAEFHTHYGGEYTEVDSEYEGDNWSCEENILKHENNGFDFLVPGLRSYPWDCVDLEQLNIKLLREGEMKGTPHHLLSLFNSHDFSGINPRGQRHYDLEVIGENNGLGVLAHPGRYLDRSWARIFDEKPTFEEYRAWYSPYFGQYSHLVGMEIYSKGNENVVENRKLWDYLLISFRRPLWGFSAADARREDQVGYNCNTFFLENHDESELKEEMKLSGGAFYFSYDPNQNLEFPEISSITVNDKSIDIIVEGDYDKITWISAGQEEVHEGSKIKYINKRDIRYYLRAVIHGNNNSVTCTQPWTIQNINLI